MNTENNKLIETKVTIAFEAEIYAVLQHTARENRRSINKEVNYILAQYAKEYLDNASQQLPSKRQLSMAKIAKLAKEQLCLK